MGTKQIGSAAAEVQRQEGRMKKERKKYATTLKLLLEPVIRG
jgi:hypothetical protein